MTGSTNQIGIDFLTRVTDARHSAFPEFSSEPRCLMDRILMLIILRIIMGEIDEDFVDYHDEDNHRSECGCR